MIHRRRTFILSFCCSLFCAAAVAGFAAAPTSPTPGFTPVDTASAGFSVTRRSTLQGGAGTVAVQRMEAEAGGRTTWSSGAALLHGLGYVRTELDRQGAIGLPDTLLEVSARLGWQQTIDSRWRIMALARPGFYGSGGSLESDSFNVPFLGLASYVASRELIWSFGVVANAFGDNPVLPIAGVRWVFAPQWTFNVGLPRTGMAWEISPETTLTAGATVQGGAYRVRREVGSAVAARRVESELDYREIRVGLGMQQKLTPALVLSVDAGVAVDQRFDFHDRGLEYRGSDEFFAAVALSGKF